MIIKIVRAAADDAQVERRGWIVWSAAQAEVTLEVQHFRSLEEHKSWTRNLSTIRLPRMRSKRMSTTTTSSMASRRCLPHPPWPSLHPLRTTQGRRHLQGEEFVKTKK